MKKHLRVLGYLVLAVCLGFGTTSVAYGADFVTMSQAITISVPQILSISADTGAFTLTFTDYLSGSVTDTKTVTYTVKCNNMRQADGAPAINANLDFLYDRIAMQASVGTYVKTSGNTGLVAAAAGFVPIGTANVALANKGNTTVGSDGKLLNGVIPITYRGVATADVPSGPQTHVLFVTLTSI